MKSRVIFGSLVVFLVLGAGALAQQSPTEVAGAETIDAAKAKVLYDRGVVKYRVTLTNQDGEPVLRYIDIVLLAKRTA